MSSRENIQRLFEKKPAERVGLHDSPWGRTVRKWVTQGYPTRKVTKTVEENGKQVEKEVDEPVPPVEHFGFDTSLRYEHTRCRRIECGLSRIRVPVHHKELQGFFCVGGLHSP